MKYLICAVLFMLAPQSSQAFNGVHEIRVLLDAAARENLFPLLAGAQTFERRYDALARYPLQLTQYRQNPNCATVNNADEATAAIAIRQFALMAQYRRKELGRFAYGTQMVGLNNAYSLKVEALEVLRSSPELNFNPYPLVLAFNGAAC